MHPSRIQRLVRSIAAAAVLGAALGPGRTEVAAAPFGQPSGVPAGEGATYRLVDTWQDRPWQLTPGRYGRTADISSAPDGTTYILDNRDTAARPGAVHVLDRAGIAQAVFTVPPPDENGLVDAQWRPQRLDVGRDGTVHVLEFNNSPTRVGDALFWVYRLSRYSGAGRLLGQFEVLLEPPRHFVDLAVADDGRLYVTRAGQNPWCFDPGQEEELTNRPGEPPSYAVDVYDPATGTLLAQLTPPELKVPTMLDVGRDGRVWVLSRIPPSCGTGPGDPTIPTATPRPSLAGRADQTAPHPAGALQAPAPGQPVNGIVVLRPDHSVEEGIPDLGDDEIAVGPAGVFVSRNVDIYRVHDADPLKGGRRWVDTEPLFTGPTDHVYAGFLRRILFNLDVPDDGRLLASMNHCYFQGLLSFDDLAAKPLEARLNGGYDAPELEGPAYPIRVAAAEDVAVLLGRMLVGGSRQTGALTYSLTNWTTDGQAVQRWTPDGRLGSQLGLCPDADIWFGSDAWVTRDIAVDGDTVYTIDPELLQKRPDDHWPSWTYWPGGLLIDDLDAASFLGAVSADGGLVATLDLGANSVVLVDAAGALVRSWSVDAGGDIALPVDVALSGDRVAIADQLRSRVYVRDLDGRAVADWPLHDGPRAIAAGPGGDLVVLGRGGWGHHYAPDGRLVASWPLPDAAVEARDIAVGDDGRVYVNFVRLGPTVEFGWDSRAPIEAAGVWVFERTPAPLSPPPPPRACVPSRDKSAAPRRIPLGDTVEVTLTVNGWCPGTFDKADIVVVFDTSRSMTFQDSFGQGKAAALAFLAELDGANTRVGLVTFDSGPTLLSPLTGDVAAIRARIAALGANGDTQLAGALDAARLAFQTADPPSAPDVRKIVVIVTDGIIKDDPLPLAAVAALDAAGAAIHALVFPSWDFNNVHRDNLDVVVGNAAGDKPGRVHLNPTEAHVEAIARNLTGYTPENGLFETIRIDDVVPANMAYVAGSAVPPASFDAAANVLRWTFGATPSSTTLQMRYRLRPRQVGTWPTNVRADARYRDALGHDGTIVFPVPEVEVFGLDHRVYLPLALRTGCLIKRRPLDVALVLDASSSMTEPSATGAGTKLDAARAAARAFVALVDPDDRVAVVSFNQAATRHIGLTADTAALDAALDAITSALGTRIDLGLVEAEAVLADRRAAALPVVVVLTDGLQNDPPGNAPVLAAAARLKAGEAIVFAIGLGGTIDRTLLEAVATTPDRFYASPTDQDLAAIYADIQGRLACEGQ